MTHKEKEKIAKKISLILAEALESNKITLEKAGSLAQLCIKQMDTANSMAEFKAILKNNNDLMLTPLIYEIFGDAKK